MDEVYSREFIDNLLELGCKAVIYVEFVPVTEDAKHLAPDDLARQIMNTKLAELRKDVEEMVFISFPGDEKSSGGCILFEKRAQVEELIK